MPVDIWFYQVAVMLNDGHTTVSGMSRIIGIIWSGLRVATATFRRRLLLALALSLVVAIPSYAAIISNQAEHVVTIQDVTITTTPSANYALPSGSAESGTVTVSTPQAFDGVLTLSITNTTAVSSTMNIASFTVTIDSVQIDGLGTQNAATIAYFSATTHIIPGYIFHYTVSFLSKAEDANNGIWSGTTYQISQLVSE
jgi:hypothetical protein